MTHCDLSVIELSYINNSFLPIFTNADSKTYPLIVRGKFESEIDHCVRNVLLDNNDVSTKKLYSCKNLCCKRFETKVVKNYTNS